MNQNMQNPQAQFNKASEHFSQSHHTQNSNAILNPNISPLSHVYILKTEEQKEIVRTNIFEPNNSNANNNDHFCVVTEVIRRKSNIPLDPKPNTSNKIDINFSFNHPMVDNTLNQNIQNKTVNINIVDNDIEKIKKEENYKILIKRIAMQLKNKIRPPTHGFFYFAMQKGQYPLVIIKKFEDKIINHTIDLNSDIFNVYSEKYLKYKALVKKIALLLKANMKHLFWENDKYQNQSIQVKVTNKNNNMNTTNIKTKNNVPGQSNFAQKKNVNINKSNMQNNKKIINVKTTQINSVGYGNNIINNQKKIKSHNLKSTTVTSTNNMASHRLNPVTNPFNATARTQNQIQKKLNFSKKVEQNNKSNLFNNKQMKNKNINNIEQNKSISASSETNKNEKIKFNHFGKLQNINKEIPINNSVNNNVEIISDKIQTITLSKKNVNNNIVTNNNNDINNVQKTMDDYNDVEMKDEKNVNQIVETINNNNNNMNITIEPKKSLNMKIIPTRETITSVNNNTVNNSMDIEMNNIQNNNNSNNTTSIIRTDNIKRITLDSVKSPAKKLAIKLSTFRKSEDIIKTNMAQTSNMAQSQTKITPKKIDISEIIAPLDNTKITDEHISFINKFKVLLSSNGLSMEYNIPMAYNEEGKYYLKKNEFWEKFVNYVFVNYLMEKKNKLSIFSFLYLIEQYFLWCEIPSPEYANEFKKLIIETMNKVFTQKEITQFLLMNKLNKLEELFNKYELFLKYGNKNNYMKNNEIEIKIDNGEECNCELCQNQKACIRKISEMNKSTNIDVNVESIMIEAQNPPNEKSKENGIGQYQTDNYFISFQGKNKTGLFSKSKTLHSFESVYQYVPPRFNIKEEEKEEEIKPASDKKKSKSKSKSKSKDKRSSTKDKKEKENFIDVSNNAKIEDYVKKEEKEEDKDDKENSENKKRSRKKSLKKNNNKKNKKTNITKYMEDSDIESEEEKEKEKEKDKKKKKRKSKSRNKSYSRKYIDTESETESEESDYIKNKNKKSNQYPKKKKGKSKM